MQPRRPLRVASAVLDAGCFRVLMTDRRSLGYLGARRFCRPSIYALCGVVRAPGRDRQAEFGAILCLTVPKTRFKGSKTGPTGSFLPQNLPDGAPNGVPWLEDGADCMQVLHELWEVM